MDLNRKRIALVTILLKVFGIHLNQFLKTVKEKKEFIQHSEQGQVDVFELIN